MLESYALPLLAIPTADFSASQLAESSDSTIHTNAAPLIQPEAIAPPETVSEPIIVPPALTEIGVEAASPAVDETSTPESSSQNSSTGNMPQVESAGNSSSNSPG
ncbi:MAG: hypothetical protein HC840_18290, partial [Leptolyngbyaceae cyanobacterium RM2_2_4]|nr:hypothetical protein [Leptolyngbyaceae cyanobacterium RM2_2_4]